MQLTLTDIQQTQNRLRQEIMERECLLSVLGVFQDYAAKGLRPRSLELGALASTLVPALAESKTEPVAAPTKSPVPPRPVNPELAAIGHGHSSQTKLVLWAIRQMQDHYSVSDLTACLRREGYNFDSSQISVVLTRLKDRGEIIELSRGKGRRPSVFLKVASAIVPDQEGAGQMDDKNP